MNELTTRIEADKNEHAGASMLPAGRLAILCALSCGLLHGQDVLATKASAEVTDEPLPVTLTSTSILDMGHRDSGKAPGNVSFWRTPILETSVAMDLAADSAADTQADQGALTWREKPSMPPPQKMNRSQEERIIALSTVLGPS